MNLLPSLLNASSVVLKVLIVIGIIAIFANATWYLFSGPETVRFGNENQTSSVRDTAPVDIEKIIEANLFGRTEAVSAPTENLQRTNLNLILLGILNNDQRSGESAAIIATGNNTRNAKTYRVGDMISGYARVEEINPLRVILSRGGRREQLAFKDSTIFKPNENRNRETDVVTPKDQLSGLLRRAIGIDSTATALEAEALDDPQALLTRFGLDFQSSDGNSHYRVSGDSGSSIVNEVGLKPGDVIVSLNGELLDKKPSELSFRSKLESGSSARIEIQRGDRRFFMTVPIP